MANLRASAFVMANLRASAFVMATIRAAFVMATIRAAFVMATIRAQHSLWPQYEHSIRYGYNTSISIRYGHNTSTAFVMDTTRAAFWVFCRRFG